MVSWTIRYDILLKTHFIMPLLKFFRPFCAVTWFTVFLHLRFCYNSCSFNLAISFIINWRFKHFCSTSDSWLHFANKSIKAAVQMTGGRLKMFWTSLWILLMLLRNAYMFLNGLWDLISFYLDMMIMNYGETIRQLVGFEGHVTLKCGKPDDWNLTLFTLPGHQARSLYCGYHPVWWGCYNGSDFLCRLRLSSK